MTDDVRERIIKASQACADMGRGPDTVLVPIDIADQFDCAGDLHVFAGTTPPTRCNCGAKTLGAKGFYV